MPNRAATPEPVDRIPLLFVPGAPKGGTTTLYEMLAECPGISPAEPKEPHFFDVNFKEGLQGYLEAHFNCTPSSRFLLDATPHYLFPPYVPARIHELAPRSRFVVLLREPVQRAYSDWWMYWTRGTEPLPFKDAIARNLRRLDSGRSFLGDDAEERWSAYYRQTVSATRSQIQDRPYVELGHYVDQLERFLAYFDRDRFYVVLSERFRRRPTAIVRGILGWLGLPSDQPISGPRNENRAMGGLARSVYRAARGARLEPLLHVLPRRVRTGIKRFTAAVTPRPPMPAETQVRLSEHYAPYNERLRQLIDVDLSEWS